MPDNTTPSASVAEPTSAGATSPTTYRGRRIRQLELERDDLRAAIHTVLTEGKSYTLSNSHSVTSADVADIESRLAAVNQELAELMMRKPFSTLRREPTKFH